MIDVVVGALIVTLVILIATVSALVVRGRLGDVDRALVPAVLAIMNVIALFVAIAHWSPLL